MFDEICNEGNQIEICMIYVIYVIISLKKYYKIDIFEIFVVR